MKETLTAEQRKRLLPRGALARVSESTGYTFGYVSQVNNGNARCRKVEVAIARKLNRPVDECFPWMNVFRLKTRRVMLMHRC